MSSTDSIAPSVSLLQQRIKPLQQKLADHPIYASVQTLAHLRSFMEAHVFAVWDFMSLLKSLQRSLTTVDVPWFPTKHRASRRFINEIVLGEESDEYDGEPVSHFEIYLDAMESAGADLSAIHSLLRAAEDGGLSSMNVALKSAPAAAQAFVNTTFRFIRDGSLAAQAAAFTFGREDAIPGMFRALVRDLNHEMKGDLNQFVWYLERHIEVDGDDHGPLSLRMVTDICGNDPDAWEQAARAAEDSLRARLSLWDGILSQLQNVS